MTVDTLYRIKAILIVIAVILTNILLLPVLLEKIAMDVPEEDAVEILDKAIMLSYTPEQKGRMYIKQGTLYYVRLKDSRSAKESYEKAFEILKDSKKQSSLLNDSIKQLYELGYCEQILSLANINQSNIVPKCYILRGDLNFALDYYTNSPMMSSEDYAIKSYVEKTLGEDEKSLITYAKAIKLAIPEEKDKIEKIYNDFISYENTYLSNKKNKVDQEYNLKRKK